MENIEFHEKSYHSSEFQKKISKDIKKIREDSNVYVKGKISTKYYKMSKESYGKHKN